MNVRKLLAEETRQSDFTHVIEILRTDLTDTAGTSKTIDLITGLGLGHLIQGAAFVLNTPFAGTSITALKLDVGYDLTAGTDDPDAILDNYEICVAGTEILAGDGNGAIFATLRTGFAFEETGKITATFTATGANLTALTAGKVTVYLRVVNLNDFA